MTTASRYRTPGVYFERLDLRPALDGVRTDIAGFVGIAERGPLFSPVRVETMTQFLSTFGGFIPNGYLAYAVEGFFANGGRVCYAVRVADADQAQAATITVADANGGPLLSLVATSPGVWGNAIHVQTARLGEDRFTLTLEGPGGVREAFRNLSMNSADSRRHAITVINKTEGSAFVRAVTPLGTPSGHEYLRGGEDGLTSLEASHIQRGLDLLAKVDEVSILAAPDIMEKPAWVQEPSRAPEHRCDILDLPDDGPRYTVQENDTIEAIAEQYGLNAEELRRANGLPEGVTLTPGQSLRVPPPPLPQPEYPPALPVSVLQSALVAQCELLRDRFAILDTPPGVRTAQGAIAWRNPFTSAFAALYYPWVKAPDPLRLGDSTVRDVPPSGHLAGVYARTDLAIGVHRAPANVELLSVLDTVDSVSDIAHGDLNEAGVNAIRPYPGRGIRVMGARSTSSEIEWRYLNLRRLLSMIEESMEEQMQWTVFEPGNRLLWLSIERVLTSYLTRLWERGMLDGATTEEAFSVRCDESTNTPQDQANGRVTTEIRLCFAWPMEVIVVRIGRTEDGTTFVEESPA